ncbi:MAG: response regulator [Lachnospiraceae bacterium]|nr:response regulator [Lachnospiraceae bacterium]
MRGYTILISDVTETYNQIKYISDMREKAEAASKAKTAFLANMSHEIRTPMNAVVGLSELIIEESRGRKMYDYACEIKSAALNLLSIINDILDLSKVEAGKMVLVKDAYYTQIFIQDIVNLVKVAAAQKGLQLKVDMSEDLPYRLDGDEGRIRQILINILNNAIKFTKNGYVRFSIEGQYIDDNRYELCFVIEDTGIGIRKEDFKNIFESFQQLDMNINRKNEGTGLGLAITRSLVQLMDGSIDIDSEYGKGTTFTVKLVQEVVDTKTIKEEPVTREGLQETDRRMFKSEGYRVLVVDDNIINRKIVVAMMKEYDFDIDDCDSGKKAIELAKEKAYDMVLMDHMMPEMDGVEATRIIRSECSLNSDATIIALTANAIEGAREMYLSNGFEDFLAKPFERIQLHELLNKLIDDIKKQYVENIVKADKISEDQLAEIYMNGIDVRDAIKKRNCTIEDYLELLNLFYLEGKNKKPYMRQLFFDGDYKNYGIEAHALKSAAANIGAYKLSEKAKELEFAVKEDKIEDVFQNYNTLDIDYGNILDEIESVLRKKEYGKFQNRDDQQLVEADMNFIVGNISQILSKLESFKPKEALAGINELLSYNMNEDIRDGLNQVVTLLSLYEDDKAEEELHKLVNAYEQK